MNDFDQFERQLGDALRVDADLGVGPFEPASVARAAIAGAERRAWRLRRASSRPARRSGRGRGLTLLAAAAVLVVGGALAAGSGLLRLPSFVPPVRAPSFGVVVTESPEATAPSASDFAGPAAAPDPSAFPRSTGVWIATGSMGTPRFGHTAVRLLDGRMLVVGGADDEDDTSAELYDPDTGTWSATGRMVKPHVGFPATLLRDGRVLVGDTDGAEVYDPDSGTWAATGRMVKADPGTSTLLRDGRVLVTGWFGTSSQVYDPLNGMWTSTGKMVTPRVGHAATLQPDGKVLVVGGHDGGFETFASAELYDPATGTWIAIAPMHTAKASITSTLLPNGKVLVVGATPRQPTPPELYDTATGTWTVIGDPSARTFDRSATLLWDGTVLLTDAADAVLYDPGTGSWTATGTMLAPGAGYEAPATPLLDGTVLVAGGRECLPEVDGRPGECKKTGSAELYVPAGVSPPSAVLALPSSATTPSPTPSPTPVPPQAGPIPPGARTWKVTVMNKSSQPATLFVAKEDEQGLMGPLVGSATPNVVAAGATVKVTFLIPAKGTDWAIFVNPGPDTGPVRGPDEMSLPGQIYINPSNQPGWLSP